MIRGRLGGDDGLMPSAVVIFAFWTKILRGVGTSSSMSGSPIACEMVPDDGSMGKVSSNRNF